jgi:hypothetical protein
MAVTVELAAWLRTRVDGLQITTVHGTPQVAERLLELLAGEDGRKALKEPRHA